LIFESIREHSQLFDALLAGKKYKNVIQVINDSQGFAAEIINTIPKFQDFDSFA
jgi:hypothetical protein